MSGNILELTDQNFEQIVSESKKPVLIDFWAPWCGPCRMLTPILENMSVEYGERITFAKINVDENPTAAIRFNINGIPTVLIFKDGKVFKEVIGVRSADEYKVMFEDVLKLSGDIESKIPNIINVKGMSDFQSHISKPGKVVLVDFWAPWCGPCRMLGPVLEKLLETHSDNLVVLKVNVEEPGNQELAANYGVSSIPHVNIMKDGKHVDQFIGALPYETIEQYIKKYM